jgi:hypothetical protein
MAIETPNNFLAAGVFNPDPNLVPSPPFVPGLTPIESAEGFQPYDPSGTPLDPKGGFTKLAPGSYVLKLMEGIDPFEGVVFVDPITEPDDETPVFLVTGVGVIIPVVPQNPIIAANLPPNTDDYKSIMVGLSPIQGEGPQFIDWPFQIGVWRYATGPKFADSVL